MTPEAIASAESVVAATIIELGNAELLPNLKQVLNHSPEIFSDQRHGILVAATRALRSEGKPVSISSLVERAQFTDAREFALLCLQSAMSEQIAECEAGSILAEFTKRQRHEVTAQAAMELEAHPDLHRAITRHLTDTLASLDNARDGLPEFVDGADFIATPLERSPEIVKGLLHQGSKLVLGGGSKSFKTWTLLDLALSVAHGADWLGHTTTKGRVLYVNFEIQPQPWQDRIRRVADAMGIEITAGAITLLNLRGKAADFQTLMPAIVEKCRNQGFALIVLDPIYKLYGRVDENKAGDVAALLNSLESLTVETGAAVAFGAHFSKGNQSGKEAMDRISGSGVFARDPDSILIFTKHEQDDCFTVEPILRNFAPVAPFVVRWDFPLMHVASELDPTELKQAAGRKPEHVPDDLLKLLPETGLQGHEWQETAAENGIARAKYFRLKSRLESNDRVIHSKVDGKWLPVSKSQNGFAQ